MIASEISCSQAQVSRLMRGQAVRRSNLVNKLINYSLRACLDHPDRRHRLDQVIAEIWDGSRAHADAMADLLQAAAAIAPKQDRTQ